jgi:predicted DCC family thiol-disulfide oxidoreductase YuxK
MDIVHYDGHCPLCHAWVRFLIAQDPDGSRFRFTARTDPPADTIIVTEASGARRTRSDAVLYLLRRCGFPWVLLSAMGRVAPARWRDALYDLVARHRRSFGTTKELCPAVPAHLRNRFL